MYFDADEELKLAIKVEAARASKSASVLIAEILRRELAGAVEEAKKSLQQRKKKEAKGG